MTKRTVIVKSEHTCDHVKCGKRMPNNRLTLSAWYLPPKEKNGSRKTLLTLHLDVDCLRKVALETGGKVALDRMDKILAEIGDEVREDDSGETATTTEE